MRENKAMPWIGGAVVLSLLVVVAGWFLAISPALDAASLSRAQTVDERDRNALLRQQNATLKEQFGHLEEYQAQLAALQVQIPPEGDLSGLTRQIDSLAATAGLTTTVFSATTPQAFVPAVAAPVTDTAAAPADGAATEGAATDTAAAAPVAPSYAGLYAVPISLTTVGTYDATVAFLDTLQHSTSRLFLVGTISASAQPDAGAGSGKPATSAGDLETVITGFAYVLQDPAAAAAVPVPDPAATPEPMPEPGAARNPFVPVA